MSPPVAAMTHDKTTVGVIFASNSMACGDADDAENPPAGILAREPGYLPSSDEWTDLCSRSMAAVEVVLGTLSKAAR